MDNQRAIYEIGLKDKFSKSFDKLGKGVDKFEKKTVDANKNIGNSFDSIKNKLLGLGLVAGAGILIKNMAKLGIEMEQTRVSFTTFLGSAEKANKSISELNEFSNVTPFDNAQVIKAGKGLLAFGVAQDDLIPSLKKIGDISAGTGKDFNELAVIYGKAKVAGTLYAEDINQLVEAGVPIMGEFAKALGVTEDKVKKMASEGKLKFKDLEKAFDNLTGAGGMFFDLMQKQSETVGGKLSTIAGKLQLVGATLGESLTTKLSPVLDSVISKLDMMVERIDLLINPIKSKKANAFSAINTFANDRREVLNNLKEIEKLKASGGSEADITALQRAIAAKFPESAIIEDGILKSISVSSLNRVFKERGEVIELGFSDFVHTIGVKKKELEQEIKGIESSLSSIVLRRPGDPGFLSAADKLVALDELSKKREELITITKDLADSERQLNKIERFGITSTRTFQGGANAANAAAAAALTNPPVKKTKISSAITGSSPKNVTLNIGVLKGIETVNTSTITEGLQKMDEAVKRVLLTALNDVAIVNS